MVLHSHQFRVAGQEVCLFLVKLKRLMFELYSVWEQFCGQSKISYVQTEQHKLCSTTAKKEKAAAAANSGNSISEKWDLWEFFEVGVSFKH